MDKVNVAVTVNGTNYDRDVEPRMLLSDFLRESLGLTGTHVGCEHGVCGTCTILVDGNSMRSCLAFAVQADGCEIESVESLGSIGDMHALQDAFWEKHGLQCGFCTPGMLMVAVELLRDNPNPSHEEIREAVSSNLCRCTGYQTIIESIELAAQRMRQQEAAE